MFRILTILTIVVLAMTFAGCSMCCGPYDYHYPVFGGKFNRVNPTHGRVGSVYSDPMFAGSGPSSDSNLETPEPFYQPDDDLNGDEDLEDPGSLDDDLDDIRRRIDEREGLDGTDVDDLPDPDTLRNGGDEDLPDPDTLTRPDGEARARSQSRRAWR